MVVIALSESEVALRILVSNTLAQPFDLKEIHMRHQPQVSLCRILKHQRKPICDKLPVELRLLDRVRVH